MKRAAGLVTDLQLAVGGQLGGEPWPGPGGGQRRGASAPPRPSSPRRPGRASPPRHGRLRRPGWSRSSTRTRTPRRAARHAQASPIAPPPTTTASERLRRTVRGRAISSAARRRRRASRWPLTVVGHGRLPSSRAGGSAPPFLRRHYPDQVQTVGGRMPPSQPQLTGLPLWVHGTPVAARYWDRWPRTALSGCACSRRRGSTSSARASRQAAIPAPCSTRRCGAAPTSSSYARSPRAAPRS